MGRIGLVPDFAPLGKPPVGMAAAESHGAASRITASGAASREVVGVVGLVAALCGVLVVDGRHFLANHRM
jgi:hypothetical protein